MRLYPRHAIPENSDCTRGQRILHSYVLEAPGCESLGIYRNGRCIFWYIFTLAETFHYQGNIIEYIITVAANKQDITYVSSLGVLQVCVLY